MTRIEFAEEVVEDFDRIIEHLLAHDSDAAPDRVANIVSAIETLKHNPEIGRPSAAGSRALVIGRGASGYVALYRFVEADDVVFVLAIRGQREAGYVR